MGVVGVVGLQLNAVMRELTLTIGLQLGTYHNYGVPYESGLTTFEEAVNFICMALAIIFWSWAGGIALESVARRTVWLTGALYSLVSVYILPLVVFPGHDSPVRTSSRN